MTETDAELAFQDAAKRAQSRVPPPEPMPIAIEALPAGWGDMRGAVCGCGEKFTQTKLADWTPTKCQTCRGAIAQRITEDTEHAKASLRVAGLEVPPKYRDARIETFTTHGAEEDRKRHVRLTTAARRYLNDWPDVHEVLVFRGGPGTGKGHLAWSLAKELVRLHDVSVRVVKLADAVRDLREAWRSEGGLSEAARLERYRSPGLLIIDEVSRHAFYGEPHRHLYDLVDHRIEQCRPTILTTNESKQGLADLLLPALTSRIAGSGMWEFGEVDYRLTKGRAA